MNTINKNLKEFRSKKGLTQQELADKLFVTRQCISRWEQGKTLPDITNIEKLSEILDCTINDLVDNNSIKTIAINQAIGNRKNKKLLLISLCISIGAMVAVILSVLAYNRPTDQNPISIYSYSGYVEAIDYNAETLKVIEESSNQTYEIDYSTSPSSIKDNRKNDIDFKDIHIQDKLSINHYLDDNTYSIQVIDSVVDEALYGIFISGTGKDYVTISDIENDPSVQYIEVSDRSSKLKNIQNYDIDSVLEEFYFEEIYDIYVSINPLEVTEDIEIWLITSNGLRLEETVDIDKFISHYSFKGERNFEASDYGTLGYIDSFNITYNIHFQSAFSYTSLEIYEYDKSNNLVNETTIYNLQDLRMFNANPNALRCLIKVNTRKAGSISTWIDSVVYQTYLGEKINLYQSDDYGFVFDEWFVYN